MERYGVPYRGSKNKIAKWVVDNLPQGETLVDLFAGGCAVTHAAMLSGKWRNFIVNDISDAPQLFADAVAGKYHDESRWISREDFFKLKDADRYVSLCWSFGNNRKDYMYAKTLEPWKKALWYARKLNDTSLLEEMGIHSDGSSKDILAHKDEYKQLYIKWWSSGHDTTPTNLERIQSLESLERLERIQSLESLERDYRQVAIPDNAVVYADPPYRGTNCDGYTGGAFDHETFDKWLAEVPFMVVVSEYVAPAGCVEVASKYKQRCMGTGNKGGSDTEKLFVQERFVEQYRRVIDA